MTQDEKRLRVEILRLHALLDEACELLSCEVDWTAIEDFKRRAKAGRLGFERNDLLRRSGGLDKGIEKTRPSRSNPV